LTAKVIIASLAHKVNSLFSKFNRNFSTAAAGAKTPAPFPEPGIKHPQASQSFAAAAAKENEIIFSGGVYVGENTLRGVSVELSAKTDNRGAERSDILLKKVAVPLF